MEMIKIKKKRLKRESSRMISRQYVSLFLISNNTDLFNFLKNMSIWQKKSAQNIYFLSRKFSDNVLFKLNSICGQHNNKKKS